jgi:hypothetical protein
VGNKHLESILQIIQRMKKRPTDRKQKAKGGMILRQNNYTIIVLNKSKD